MLRLLFLAALVAVVSGAAAAASSPAIEEDLFIVFRNVLIRAAPTVTKNNPVSLLQEEKALLVKAMRTRLMPSRVNTYAEELLVGVTCDSYAEYRKEGKTPTTADVTRSAEEHLALMSIPIEDHAKDLLTAAAKALLESMRGQEWQISLLNVGIELSYEQQCVRALQQL